MTFKLAAVSTVRTLTNDLTPWPEQVGQDHSVYAAVFYQKPCFLMNETMAWPWECAALRLWRYFRTVNDGLAVGHPPPSGSPPHSGTVRGRSEGACGSRPRGGYDPSSSSCHHLSRQCVQYPSMSILKATLPPSALCWLVSSVSNHWWPLIFSFSFEPKTQSWCRPKGNTFSNATLRAIFENSVLLQSK